MTSFAGLSIAREARRRAYRGGGAWHDMFNLSGSYSPPGCYFAGGQPSFATLREVGGSLSRIGLLGGVSAVFAGFALTTAIVLGTAWVTEHAIKTARDDISGRR